MYRLRPVISLADKIGIDAVTALIQSYCDNVYMTHAYEYEELAKSMDYEYDPISNYDMIESENIKNSGDDTTTDRRGERIDVETLGDTSVTLSAGKRRSERASNGDVVPFDSDSYKKLDKNFDVETQDPTVDTTTSQAVDNTFTTGVQTVSSTLDHGHIIDRKLTRKGNIGVTTTQQMIMSQREVVKMNLVRLVANDIIQTICVPVINIG